MPQRSPKQIARQARAHIERIRAALAAIDYLCSGTLLERTKVCGKPNCRCATDPAARLGPYYEWGHMRAGKLMHRQVSAEPAELLRQVIDSHRYAQQLLRDWVTETGQLIDAELPRTR